MKTTFVKKQAQLAAACALTLGFMSGAVYAQSAAPIFAPQEQRNLVTNTVSQQVWMNGFGECWHNQFGPAPLPNLPCGPQPVAQYIPPAPAQAQYIAPPIVVAKAAEYERVTFDTNVLFDFDKSTLRQAGKDSLDDFVARIKGVGTEQITAIGYADRFGTDGYNQSLSERRVATVKSYLQAKGIEGRWVSSSGKGESESTTKPGECKGAKSSSTIACLQPDRHVFIEVSGQKLKN